MLEDLLDHLLVNGMVVGRVQCDAWTKYILSGRPTLQFGSHMSPRYRNQNLIDFTGHQSLKPLPKRHFVMVIQFGPNLVQKRDSFTH